MTADVHLHSEFSFDSEEKQENYVKKALDLGESVIGFCEHYDYDAFLQGEDLGLVNCEAFFESITSLRKKYPNIKILAGIELGYSREAEAKYRQLEPIYPFDYIVYSVHTLPLYGDFYNGSAFIGRTASETYVDYLNALYESVISPIESHIIAHLGYAQRYCKTDDSDISYTQFPDLIDKILIGIIDRKKCLEINTSTAGLKKYFIPDKSIIDRYIELGGTRFSFASDAHSVDRYLDKAQIVKSYLKKKNIDHMYYFEDRHEVKYDI